MGAVQNLKSRWTALATPMTPTAAPPPLQQATIKPTSYSTPLNPTTIVQPSTPTLKSGKPVRPVHSGSTTPQKNIPAYNNTTPKSANSIKTPPCLNTPRTPNSSLSSVSYLC